MRFYYLVTMLTLIHITTATTNKAASDLQGTPCTELLSSQADKLLTVTTPQLLATELLPTTIQNQITSSITAALAQLPKCQASQALHISLRPEPLVSIFFPTDTPTAIPSLFTTRIPAICQIHHVEGLYRVTGIDDSGPGASFLTFRGARMVAFDVSEDAVVKIEVRISCDGEEVGTVPFGDFTVAGLRDVLGRGFMVARVGEA